MCGIIFINRFDNRAARKLLLKRYHAQKLRGQEGYGFVSITRDHHTQSWQRAEKEEQIFKKLATLEETPHILFHHRTPTSTPNLAEAAHPIVVDNPALAHVYFVVHNGIIWNAETLKPEHEKQGYKYTTLLEKFYRIGDKETPAGASCFNDSEALAIEVAQVIEGKKEGIMTRGSVAFVALQVNRETLKVEKVYYGRNYGSPLKILRNAHFFMLASEGDGQEITTDMLFCFAPETGLITSIRKDIGLGYTSSSYSQTHSYNSTGASGTPWNLPSARAATYLPGEQTILDSMRAAREPKLDYDGEAVYVALTEHAIELEEWIKLSEEYKLPNEVARYSTELKKVQEVITRIDDGMKNKNLKLKAAVNSVLSDKKDEFSRYEFFEKLRK